MEGDKLLLLDNFRQRYTTPQQAPFVLADEARALWSRYSFPGNVRELRNIVIRLTAKYPGQIVHCNALEAELDLQDEPAGQVNAPPSPINAESDALIQVASRRLVQPEPFSLDQLLAETSSCSAKPFKHQAGPVC